VVGFWVWVCSLRCAEVLVWLAMTMENSILTGLSEMARAEVLVWLAMTMENSSLTGLSEMARAPELVALVAAGKPTTR